MSCSATGSRIVLHRYRQAQSSLFLSCKFTVFPNLFWNELKSKNALLSELYGHIVYETIFNLDLSSFSCTFGLLSVYKTLMYSLFASLFCVTKRETVGLELFLHYALRECAEHNSTPLIWICRTRRTVLNRSHEAKTIEMCSKLSCICWFG